jgi:hypothetical protein
MVSFCAQAVPRRTAAQQKNITMPVDMLRPGEAFICMFHRVFSDSERSNREIDVWNRAGLGYLAMQWLGETSSLSGTRLI